MKLAQWLSTLIVMVSLSLAGSGCDHKPKNASDSATANAQRWDCINHLRAIEGAKENWALANHKTANDAPTWDDIRPYLKPSMAKCPADGVYVLGRLDQVATCSIPEHEVPDHVAKALLKERGHE